MSKNLVAVVTGAANGIGKDAAFNFAKRGYNVALIDMDKNALANVENEIRTKYEVNTHSFTFDVGNFGLIQECAQQILHEFKKVDVLFNNAGIFIPGLLDLDIATAEKIFHTNFFAAFYLTKELAPSMKQQRSGHIIVLASIAGVHADPGYGMYAATKFALVGFAEALFAEMLPYNVKVSTICPSVVNTNMTKDFEFNNDDKIQTSDITTTINYLLDLGPNAMTKEIVIDCKKAVLEGKIQVPDVK